MDYLRQMPSVMIHTKAATNCSLAIRHGKVILARTDPSDPSQQWVKYSTEVKDAEGFPSFALVNKATGQAMKHSVNEVQLIPYVPDILDESVLWTLGADLGDGYRAMRMVNNTLLNVDALHDSTGGVHDGSLIGLWEWLQGENQQWKIVPHQTQQVLDSWSQMAPHQTQQVSDGWSRMPSVMIHTKAATNCSLAIRHGKVILARTDPSDLSQQWVQYSTEVKDAEGFPSFALVNKATGQAMKHSVNEVQLIPYVPDILDESVLWTLGADLGDGYRAMRMVNNTLLNVDALHDSTGGVHDGSLVGLWEWLQGENQQWKIVPY